MNPTHMVAVPFTAEDNAGPQVSVVVPTLNRAALLQDLLGDLVEQVAPGVDFEILVVDNGSTDATRDVAMTVAAKSPCVRYLNEPTLGASNARNRGIAAATAPIIAFIDDDVRPAPNWIASISRAFESNSDVDCIGGRIEPKWPEAPPSWLTSRHWGPIALQMGRGDTPYLDADHASACLVTASFACRAAVFAEVGAFSPAYRRDEDREFNLRLWRQGKRGKYEDSIVAFAQVQPDRLAKAYHRSWHGVTGRSHARMRYLEIIDHDGRLRDQPPQKGKHLFGVAGFVYRELGHRLFRLAALTLRRRHDDAFFEECRVRYLLAYLATRLKERSHAGA